MSEPPITLRAVHDSGPGNTPPSRVVIHATCPGTGYPTASGPGTALGTARYFQMAGAGGSAHYVCDGDDEQHCVPDDVIGWHAPPNPHSIGIEICSEGGDYAKSYTREQWLSAAVWPGVLRAAARTRELCQRYGLPMVKLSSADLLAGRRGICFTGDTLVLTRRGLVPIPEVVVADEVWTHRSRWRRVKSVMRRRAPVLTLAGQGHP